MAQMKLTLKTLITREPAAEGRGRAWRTRRVAPPAPSAALPLGGGGPGRPGGQSFRLAVGPEVLFAHTAYQDSRELTAVSLCLCPRLCGDSA